jgi:UTP:GlnB (protein PII) uridylyltransferase
VDQKVLAPEQPKFDGTLAKSLQLEDGSLLTHCQRLYKLEMHRLKMRHQRGTGGSQIAASRAVLIDGILQTIWEAVQKDSQTDLSKQKILVPPASLIAMGQYGSLELGPFSPVELLLLGKPPFKENAGSRLEKGLDTIQRTGFEVHVSLLGPRECLQRTQTDLPLCLSL